MYSMYILHRRKDQYENPMMSCNGIIWKCEPRSLLPLVIFLLINTRKKLIEYFTFLPYAYLGQPLIDP